MMVAQHLHSLRQDQVLVEKDPSLAPQISALPSRTGTRIVSAQAPRDQTRDPEISSISSSVPSSAVSDRSSQVLITTVLHCDAVGGVKTGNNFADDYSEEGEGDEGDVYGEDSELDASDSDYDSDEQVDDDDDRDHTKTAPSLQVVPVRQSSAQALGHNGNNKSKNSLADAMVLQQQQQQQQHLLPPLPSQPKQQRRQQHYHPRQQQQQSTLFYQDSNGGSLQEQAERRNSAQKAQQELVMQLTIAANAWAKDGSNYVASFTSIHSGVESSSDSNSNNNENSTCTTSVDNREGDLVAAVAKSSSSSSGDQDAPSRGRLLTLEEDQSESDKDDNEDQEPGAGVPPRPESRSVTYVTTTHGARTLERQAQDQLAERQHASSSSSSNGLPPLAPHIAKGRMVPYVEEEDEDEDEYDEESAEDEEEDTQDGDYSYSEDDEEEDDDDEDDEDDSLNEYHYGAKQDPRLKGSRTSGRQGQYHRSMYGHYRPPRLDEHFLQKRAITKQVTRRSSLTALLGEVSQPDQQISQLGFHTTGPAFRQQVHANGAVRRPALATVWADANATDSRPLSAIGPFDKRTASEDDARSSQSTSTDAYRRSPLGLQGPAMPKIANTQEPNRPRRTDSGVEVKLSPNTDRDSGTNSDSTTDPRRRGQFGDITIQIPSDFSPASQASPATLSSLGALSVRRIRVKSDGDMPTEGSLPLGSVAAASSSSSSSVCVEGGGSSVVPAVRYPLRSSISCQTFPRALGKRNGRKHVSWHYSLFPTEPVLKIKPSLPSLSNVAATSAEAELSKLPTIPVMARDNVESFHQSIRSLRTLSRDEITKMSYKQQGRQQLSSPVPISKSVNDSIPWWSPSRWFKASVTIDKRHWKPDDSRESCAFCFSPFHRITNPRHHCRKCGDIFCGKCASAEILMDAKNCVYVQQSQLPRWSRRVDIQRHSLWIDTLPQLHPVRTAVETGLVNGPIGNGGADSLVGQAGLNGAGGVNGYLGGVSMGHRSGSGSGSGNGRRGSWQMAPGATKKTRVSIFGLFGGAATGAPGTGGNPPFSGSDSRRGSMDVSGNDNGLLHHHHSSFLLHQPHSSNPLAVSFAAAGRRSSSSSILRTGSVNGASHHLLMSNGSNASGEGGGLLTPPIVMSRRMSSGGVGEVCLARICVGCERELLKPVPRCTSIAKYYGSVGPKNGYRPPHGYSSLGPHAGAGMASYGGGRGNGGRYESHQQHQQHQQQHQQHPQQQGGPSQYSPAEDVEPTLTSDVQQQQQHHYQTQQHTNGVRRHSPLGQTSYVAHRANDANLYSHPHQQQQQYYHQQQQQQQQQQYHGGNGYGYGTEEAIGPYGETRSNPAVLTFQEEQMRYTQQACGPMYREMS